MLAKWILPAGFSRKLSCYLVSVKLLHYDANEMTETIKTAKKWNVLWIEEKL